MPTQDQQPRAHGTLYRTGIADPRGEDLLPLSMLREHHPDLHARHVAKYAGREDRLRERVIPLDCAWSDVVFLSPLDSTVLFDAARDSGRQVWDGPVWTLDASRLDPARCCVRLMRTTPGARTADPGTADDYLPLTTATLRAVAEVTDRALRRLRTLGPDDPLLPWGDVPHVLHRGPVPLSLFRQGPPRRTPPA
ncbi:hypothetical protein OG455_02270 [Kitasatospora sp. NBC_01287]|uniref:hypothetical protein n=1 Tax=Kitasatospora sp. NBC_01287 TaxID=2903573 RepID=UPI002259B11F|nr:hypothetical protein [Kitasatospora sp. NBC_01287]MCX4744350.1 hypothetical protein [Kitasatospora sp. NBC_01287]